jgi:hypothetical protein
MSSTIKPDFTAAIARLKQIATRSADNALTEGPVNANWQLLDLCGETLHALVLKGRIARGIGCTWAT